MGGTADDSARAKRSLRDLPTRLLSNGISLATLGTAVSLPGFAELSSITDSFIDSLKDSPCNHNRCSALEFKIRSMLKLVASMDKFDHDDIQELESELRNIKGMFDRATASRRISYRTAEHHLETLDSLDKRIDYLVELIKMKTGIKATSAREIDQLDVLKAYEITDQVVLPSSLRPPSPLNELGIIPGRPDKDAGQAVTVFRCSGRIGSTRVTYITYSSARAAAAQTRIVEDLRWMSQCLHPNVSVVMGVTKGPWLNGIVLTSALLPLYDFLRRSTDPVTLARCFRELLSVKSYLELKHPPYPAIGEASVDLNGHVIIAPPSRTPDETIINTFHWRSYRGVDEYARNLISILSSETTLYFPWSNFLDLMVQCHGPFTELKMLQLAEKAKALPMSSYTYWEATAPPPFTVCVGEVGIYSRDLMKSTFEWSTIHCHRSVDDLEFSVVAWRPRKCSPALDLTPVISSDGWLTYKLPRGFYQLLLQSKLPVDDRAEWASLVAHWVHKYKELPGEVQLEALSLCTRLQFRLEVNGQLDFEALYYHRRPTARTEPRSFWGHVSTSPDPNFRDGDLENMGFEVTYVLVLVKYDIADDWGHKYKKLLRKCVRAMPGGFPVEEMEDNSDEE
ncbi:hypothetical protein FRC08_000268 [Ceratobasidium sp. 394]|nr:hypothetical protein FRC08_000268 [Ceratobasidium sp. 394]